MCFLYEMSEGGSYSKKMGATKTLKTSAFFISFVIKAQQCPESQSGFSVSQKQNYMCQPEQKTKKK